MKFIERIGVALAFTVGAFAFVALILGLVFCITTLIFWSINSGNYWWGILALFMVVFLWSFCVVSNVNDNDDAF